jgi:hypothetical protein
VLAPLLALAVVLLLTVPTARASASATTRGTTVSAISVAATKGPATSAPATGARPVVAKTNPTTASATATATAKASVTPTPTPSPKKTPPPAPGHSAWPGRLAIAAAILALLALAGFVSRRSVLARTRRSRLAPETGIQPPAHAPLPVPQRGATVPPPVAMAAGPRRQAIVCTELHPQGYVEIDRCLYRAVWAARDEPPPAPGLPVTVARSAAETADPELLLAFPPLAHGSFDAR